jgi:hypothetical protein
MLAIDCAKQITTMRISCWIGLLRCVQRRPGKDGSCTQMSFVAARRKAPSTKQ